MSNRELYEFALIELNKLQAPSLLLEDYNYFINKAIQQYANLVYNKYDVNQQATDDLRVLKTTCTLSPNKSIDGDDYYVILPKDYMHLLNCIVEYKPTGINKCDDLGKPLQFAAKRLTSDMFGGIINNVYLCPTYKRPYYFINNFNLKEDIVTNPAMDESILDYNKGGREWISPHDNSLLNCVNTSGSRLANSSEVRLELKLGKTNRYVPYKVYVDYIKAPMFVNLTLEDINTVIDRTPILEFPNYVCFEIINIFVKLIMENSSDPRLQTNPIINQTIATQPQTGGNK